MNYGNVSGDVALGFNTHLVNEGTLGNNVTLSGGELTNASTGVILGSVRDLDGNQFNFGSIGGNAYIGYRDTLVNEAGGTIAGGVFDISSDGHGTFENHGTVLGGVRLGGSGGNRLILDPTAVIVGSIKGSDNNSDTLELQSGSSVGTLSNFSQFGTIVFDTGANWVLGGSNTLTNGFGGTKIIGSGSLTVLGTLENSQSLGVSVSLASTGTLINNSTGYIGGTLADTGAVVNAGTLNAVSMAADHISLINLAGGTIKSAVTRMALATLSATQA